MIKTAALGVVVNRRRDLGTGSDVPNHRHKLRSVAGFVFGEAQGFQHRRQRAAHLHLATFNAFDVLLARGSGSCELLLRPAEAKTRGFDAITQ